MTNCPTILAHEPGAMSPKVYLSRVLAKGRVDCPGCGANVRVSTLAYVHRCKQPVSEAVIQAKFIKKREMAVKSFELRSRPMVESVVATIDTSPPPLN